MISGLSFDQSCLKGRSIVSFEKNFRENRSRPCAVPPEVRARERLWRPVRVLCSLALRPRPDAKRLALRQVSA
jgi:hypothetical protein